jgi:hypothetical protein
MWRPDDTLDSLQSSVSSSSTGGPIRRSPLWGARVCEDIDDDALYKFNQSSNQHVETAFSSANSAQGSPKLWTHINTDVIHLQIGTLVAQYLTDYYFLLSFNFPYFHMSKTAFPIFDWSKAA